LPRERPREPLHIVLYEDLHGGAVDRAGAVDGHVDAASNGHVRAEKHFCHFEHSEAKSRNLLLLRVLQHIAAMIQPAWI
jgi:hypothetical protein